MRPGSPVSWAARSADASHRAIGRANTPRRYVARTRARRRAGALSCEARDAGADAGAEPQRHTAKGFEWSDADPLCRRHRCPAWGATTLGRALLARHAMIPRATYRLQLNSGFGFAHVSRCSPYLQQLGVSHAYLSPYLKARPGSPHGYDIVDHAQLNPELGDTAPSRTCARR